MLERLLNRVSTKTLLIIICLLGGMVCSKAASVYFGFSWLEALRQ